jgi:polyhydroxyalkanoate synthesis repressor PhaR
MSEPRIIKRYANRKLYDTQHSRYVTLDQIAEMIRNGDDVKIIDNKSKEDLTSVTLAQIIFEEEKKQKSFLPLQAMRNIIQSGGESISHLVTTAQKRVTNILPGQKRAEGEEGDGARISTWREFQSWLQSSQRVVDEWQKRFVDQIASPFAPLASEVQNLRNKIAELEGKLRALVADQETQQEAQGSGEPTSTPPLEEDAG